MATVTLDAVILSPTSASIKQALVSAMRAKTTLKTAVNGFHEGFAPRKTAYPFVVYNRVSSPYEYTWESKLIHAVFDIGVWSKNSVEADNLDVLVSTTLSDSELQVAGQSTLICRRYADLGSQDVDEEGNKVYMAGGSYAITTDQPL